jgi:protein-tyrosine phosphatase
MAEGILNDKLRKFNFAATVDSAGFENFHVGDSPDDRAVRTLRKRNIDITGHVARLFTVKDFDRFDRIYVMDSSHYSGVSRLARNDDDMQKVDYLLNVIYPGSCKPVQDPWYHGMEAFESVYEQLDRACDALANKIVNGLPLN